MKSAKAKYLWEVRWHLDPSSRIAILNLFTFEPCQCAGLKTIGAKILLAQLYIVFSPASSQPALKGVANLRVFFTLMYPTQWCHHAECRKLPLFLVEQFQASQPFYWGKYTAIYLRTSFILLMPLLCEHFDCAEKLIKISIEQYVFFFFTSLSLGRKWSGCWFNPLHFLSQSPTSLDCGWI